MRCKASSGISLVEIMTALTILSMLALPAVMFLFEYVRNGSEAGDYYQVLNLLEKKMEEVCALDYASIPVGETRDLQIKGLNGQIVDLHTSKISNNLVEFKIMVEVLPLTFSALEAASSKRLLRAQAENLYKKIDIYAEWGKNGRHKIRLLTYKANL